MVRVLLGGHECLDSSDREHESVLEGIRIDTKRDRRMPKEGGNKLQLGRGCFDQVDYRDGCLILKGWMLLPDRKLDRFSVVINSEQALETEVLESDGVGKAFPSVPHAKFSGFSVSINKEPEEVTGSIDICMIGMINREHVCKIETWFFNGIFDHMPMPPKELMVRITNNDNASYYRASMLKTYRDYWEPVCRYGDRKKMQSMLDWGCGCGRLLSVFKKLADVPDIYGCDVDQEAIGWCQRNIDGVRFSVIPFFPPMDYPSNLFDLVIGNSIFTHLNKHNQLLWLEEIRRIMKPGGLFLASLHGESATYFSFPNTVKEVLKNGIYDEIEDQNLLGIAPPSYYRGTFQTQEYTRKVFAKYFTIMDYIERGSLNYQDLVVMKKSK